MKKLNLNNQLNEDDKKLISLLKTSISRKPSKQFVDNTLEKFLILKAKHEIVHKPLKSPLYLMLIIGLILFTSVFMMFNSQVALPDSEFELRNLLGSMFFQLDSWYLVALMFLVLVSISVVWMELGLIKFRNPFV